MKITDRKWFRIELPDHTEEVPAHEFVVTNNGTLVLIQSIDGDEPTPTVGYALGYWHSIARIPGKTVIQ